MIILKSLRKSKKTKKMSDKTLILPFGAREEILELQSSTDEGGTIISYIIVDGESVGIPSDQAWFWSPEWQAQHEQAIQDMETGQYIEFDDGDSFVSSLAELIDE